jgi:glycosyltransferase involved in cell wall biosynthesis
VPDRIRYACEWTPAGIGVAAQRCIRSLVAAGADVAWEPLVALGGPGRDRALDSSAAPAWMRALRRPESPDDVLVLHSVPAKWSSVSESLPARHRIGHSVWELEDLPLQWRFEMSCVDEFWVPTEWNRRTFERAFDKPVHVVPHAIELVEPCAPPITIPDGVAIVTVVSAWDWRKRPDRAIEAFCRAFTAADDVVLVVKTWPHSMQWPGLPESPAQMIAALLSRYPDAPRVLVETATWSDAEIAGLLERSACTLSLTASEGWGLAAFDAASLGVPAIITGYGGHVEYLGTDYPGLIPFEMVPTYHADTTLFERGTRWAHADIDAAIDVLRSVVDGSATALLDRAKQLGPELRDRYSADSVAAAALGACPERVRPSSTVRASTATVSAEPPEVVVLTPLKDSAHRAAAYVDRILGLEHPAERLSVAVLVSDSVDDTAAAFRSEFERLTDAGIRWSVFERDFGYRMPEDVARSDARHQVDRRTVLAKSRNQLLSRGLGDAEWALWLDGDVVDFPSDVIAQLLAVGEDVVHPNCFDSKGALFDLNAWTDQGLFHLDDYAGTGLVELHAVGGTMLLVNADRHRDGLIWPAYRHGIFNSRVRTDPSLVGRDELGEIETEGLAIMANDMGIACWGLPDLHIRHE